MSENNTAVTLIIVITCASIGIRHMNQSLPLKSKISPLLLLGFFKFCNTSNNKLETTVTTTPYVRTILSENLVDINLFVFLGNFLFFLEFFVFMRSVLVSSLDTRALPIALFCSQRNFLYSRHHLNLFFILSTHHTSLTCRDY